MPVFVHGKWIDTWTVKTSYFFPVSSQNLKAVSVCYGALVAEGVTAQDLRTP